MLHFIRNPPFGMSLKSGVVDQVTLLSLPTATSTTSCCSFDLIPGDEGQSEMQQQPPPIPLQTPLKEEKPLLLYQGSDSQLPLVASARAWILKVVAFYGFQPLTAYMSISYLDRFLSARQLLSDTNGWPYQLLSVACLSLAAKMEELMVPSLIDLQMEGVAAKQIFEPKTVQRMELLVLSVLEWRLRSVTPFDFLPLFAHKVDPTGACHGYLASQASDIILASVSDARILQYMPSCIAAAAVLYVARRIEGVCHCQCIDVEFVESWSSDGLSRESITGCCGILHDIISFTELHSSSIPTTETSSSSSSSSSSASSPSFKRRKLNDDKLWI